MSARQLRRLFAQELGTSPVAVAQTRRLLFAKQLISETSLPMADIAFSAGYSSVRRFNDAVQDAYGRTPTQLRRADEPALVASEHVDLTLFYRPPYDWALLRQCLEMQAVPGVERVDAQGYRRAVRLGDDAGVIVVQPVPEERCVHLRVPIALSRHLRLIAERIKRIFDLNADSDAICRHLSRDPLLAERFSRHAGIRLPGSWDPFATTIWMILIQTVEDAADQCRRLLATHGAPVPGDRELVLFPTPQEVMHCDLADLGMDATAAAAIHRLAVAVVQGRLVLGTRRSLDDAVAAVQAMVGVDAQGAQQIALCALSEPDACPLPPAAIPVDQAETWRPWRGYAAVLLSAAD